MKIAEINPYVRAGEIQPSIDKNTGLRFAYDNRLFYILDGIGQFITQESKREIKPNTIIFVKAGVGYDFCGNFKTVVINFDMTRSVASKKARCPASKRNFDSNEIYDKTAVDGLLDVVIAYCPNLKDSAIRLVKYFDQKSETADAITSSIVKELTTEILREQNYEQNPTVKLVDKVKRYIKMNATSESTYDSIGKALGYHPVYLADVFLKSTGQTLHKAIVNEKIRQASVWLINTELSIEEIAFETGFSSRSHFCTVFKAQMGISPGSYRKQNK